MDDVWKKRRKRGRSRQLVSITYSLFSNDPSTIGPVSRLLFLLGLLPCFAFAQALNPGDPLPAIVADTLSDAKNVSLLDRVKGRPVLVIFSFGKDSSPQVKAYGERAAKDLGNDRLWQVPVLDGAPRLIRGLILRGMRGDMPKDLHAQTLLLFKDGDLWKKRLRVSSDKHAYLVLLDKDSRIAWLGHGLFEEKKYEELRAAAARLN